MRLYTIAFEGRELPAVEGKGGEMYTLESLGIPVKDMNELIAQFGALKEEISQKIEEAQAAASDTSAASAAGTGHTPQFSACAPGTYRILAPVPVPAQDVICLGVNYMSHMSDMAQGLNFTKKQDTVYFAKRVNRANDPGGRIPVYDFVDSLDYEVELGVILGKDAFCVRREEALSYVLGCTIINDVSARNVQRKHQQWYRGKSLDGYTPMGPCIVTADEIGDIHDLEVACFVNGEKRQGSSTALMITTVEEAIEELSTGMTLKAGTIIATGTPGGVAMGMNPPRFLKKGDVVRCEISGIGQLENIVGYI